MATGSFRLHMSGSASPLMLDWRPFPCRRWHACKANQEPKRAAGSQHVATSPSGAIWTALCSTFLAAGPTLAGEGLKYDPGAGADVVKKVAGAAYVVLLAVFAVRLLSKRARSATEEARLISGF